MRTGTPGVFGGQFSGNPVKPPEIAVHGLPEKRNPAKSRVSFSFRFLSPESPRGAFQYARTSNTVTSGAPLVQRNRNSTRSHLTGGNVRALRRW